MINLEGKWPKQKWESDLTVCMGEDALMLGFIIADTCRQTYIKLYPTGPLTFFEVQFRLFYVAFLLFGKLSGNCIKMAFREKKNCFPILNSDSFPSFLHKGAAEYSRKLSVIIWKLVRSNDSNC